MPHPARAGNGTPVDAQLAVVHLHASRDQTGAVALDNRPLRRHPGRGRDRAQLAAGRVEAIRVLPRRARGRFHVAGAGREQQRVAVLPEAQRRLEPQPVTSNRASTPCACAIHARLRPTMSTPITLTPATS